MKIGLIGYGNMGSLIADNILKLNLLLEDESLIVSNRNISKIEHLKEEYLKEFDCLKLEITDNNLKVAKECEKIIIAVETPQFKEIINEISEEINENTHIIYTCAGLSFKHIETFFKGKLTLIIPTLASMTTKNNSIKSDSRRKGISLFQHNKEVSNDEKNYIEDLFNEFSYVKVIENELEINENKLNKMNKNEVNNKNENELEINTILTSCGPAFVAIILKKLSEVASKKSNLTYNEAEDLISKTISGTLEVKKDYNLSNEDIMGKVATKGGITQEGIDYLDKSFEIIATELIEHLLNRYSEVKEEMNKDYFKNL